MPGKLSVEDIKLGDVMEATFYPNAVKDSGFRYRASHLNGKRPQGRPVRRPPHPARHPVPGPHQGDSQARARRPRLHRGRIRRRQQIPHRGRLPRPRRREEAPGVAGERPEHPTRRPAGVRQDGRWPAPSPSRSAWSSSSSTAVRSSRRPTSSPPSRSGRRVPARRSPTSSRPTCSSTLEEAVERSDRRYLIFLDEFNRCQESARNALMPALDSTRRIFHPIDNRFLQIPDNVQFIAAVNRGSEFSGTFGIDAAQLDRFAPLQMDYMPPEEEVKLLQNRHPELGKKVVKIVVEIADRSAQDRTDCRAACRSGATDEACIYLKHPLIAAERSNMLPEVLKSSFCGSVQRPVERRQHRRRGGLERSREELTRAPRKDRSGRRRQGRGVKSKKTNADRAERADKTEDEESLTRQNSIRALSHLISAYLSCRRVVRVVRVRFLTLNRPRRTRGAGWSAAAAAASAARGPRSGGSAPA